MPTFSGLCKSFSFGRSVQKFWPHCHANGQDFWAFLDKRHPSCTHPIEQQNVINVQSDTVRTRIMTTRVRDEVKQRFLPLNCYSHVCIAVEQHERSSSYNVLSPNFSFPQDRVPYFLQEYSQMKANSSMLGWFSQLGLQRGGEVGIKKIFLKLSPLTFPGTSSSTHHPPSWKRSIFFLLPSPGI